MDLGIIGPIKSLKRISSIIKDNFDYININKFKYNTYHEASEIVDRHQAEIDTLLFSGTTPYKLARKVSEQEIPWGFVPRHGSTLLTTLLKASEIYKHDISKISFDCYTEKDLIKIYEEIGLNKEELNIYTAEERIMSKDYLEYLYNFHKNNHKKNVACCITGLVDVNSKLNNENIPCYKLIHTKNVIKTTVKKLHLKHLARVNQRNQIVVLAVEIDLPHEKSLYNTNEYQLALKKMKVAEQIYLFAQQIQAAVIEMKFSSYLLFSTKEILEIETKKLEQISLLQMVKSNTSSTVSIGIGYGRTAREAKYGAKKGLIRSKKGGGDQVFVVYDGEKIVGPIFSKKKNKKEKIDDYFLDISKRTGISVNSVFKLSTIIKQYKQNCFTSNELAKYYGVTRRSMNKIINKLEETGYAKIVGKKPKPGPGRPSRIIKLLIDAK